MRNSPRARIGFAALVGILALAVAGCGESSGSEASFAAPERTEVDVGLATPIVIEAGTKPKIAAFGTTGNSWLNAYNKAVEDTAKTRGVTVTLFDSKYDPQRQVDQIVSAISSGDYNAFIITSWDSDILCAPIKRAAEAGILVVTSPNTVCDRDLNEWGPDYYQPGTLAMVDAEQSVTYKRAYVSAVSERLPSGSNVVLATGPETDSLTRSMAMAVQQTLGNRDDITLLDPVYTDFTTPTALTKLQDVLTARPETTAIISVFSDITRGAIQAVEQSGMSDEVAVFDLGAQRYSLDAIKAGKLEMTVPIDPFAGGTAVDAIVDAFSGKDVPKLIDTFPDHVGGSVTDPLVIDASNVEDFDVVY
jgi:ribose transport system substrate-binding protein